MRRPEFVSVLLDRHPSPRWNLLVLSLGCVVVLSLLAASYWQITASLYAQGTLHAQAERIARLDSLMIQISDAESSVRGFLLSRDRAYLNPWEANQRTINITLNEIGQDLARNPANSALHADLSKLVEEKLKILSQSVRHGNVGTEAAAGKNADGRQYMERIRDMLSAAKLREVSDGEFAIEQSINNVHRTRWVVTILSGGALLLLLALYLLLDYQLMLRERLSELLHSENQRLELVVQERTDELSQLASYLTNAREAEQARLASELHDELGALMTVAKMDVQAIVGLLDKKVTSSVNERFEHLLDTLDRGIKIKRRLIDGLRPPLLVELGLVTALESLAKDFARLNRTKLVLDLPDEHLVLRQELALAIFRIVQEGLTNISKYAKPHKVRLSLQLKGNRIRLDLEDDGIGFDPAKVSRHRHGLAGMKHRVQMFAGEFALVSQPGRGTRITASLPLLPAKDPFAALSSLNN